MPTQKKYPHNFLFSETDEINFQTARAKYKAIEIVRLGIKTALGPMLEIAESQIKKAKEIVK